MSNKDSEKETIVLVDDSRLLPVGIRSSLLKYLRSIFKFRNYIREEAKAKASNTNQNMFLGKLWVILDPLFQSLLYALVFGLILQTSRGIDNFIGFLVIGVIYFRICIAGLNAGAGLIQKSRNMLSVFNFPTASLAFAETLRIALVNITPALIAVIVAMALQPSDLPGWSLLWLPVIYLILIVFTLGLTLCIGRLTSLIPDLQALISIFTRGLFFVSGIFYSIERFDSVPEIRMVMQANPIYQFLTIVRIVVLEGETPPLSLWVSLLCWSFGLAFVGTIFFWRGEGSYADVK